MQSPKAKAGVIFQGDACDSLGGIRLAGYVTSRSRVAAEPTRALDHYALVYILDGQGTYHDPGSAAQNLCPGDLLLIPPDLPHTYGPSSPASWAEFYLLFAGSIFDLWRNSRLLATRTALVHLEPIPSWLQRLHQVVHPSHPRAAEQALDQLCRLQQLLADILAHRTLHNSTDDDWTWLQRAKSALNLLDSAANPDWQTLSLQLDTTYDGFRKRFTRLAGLSPGRYHAARLIARACDLIQSDHMTNRQVAQALGFCDEFHFSRRFKQAMGISPQQFRQFIA